jgi:PPM family protein phosphatase
LRESTIVAELRTAAAVVLGASARTHPGRVRLNNEDLPVLDAARGVFGVIDGIGGQAGGEVAAATARDVILQRLARPIGTPGERVREAIAIANNEIYRRAASSPNLAAWAA